MITVLLAVNIVVVVVVVIIVVLVVVYFLAVSFFLCAPEISTKMYSQKIYIQCMEKVFVQLRVAN